MVELLHLAVDGQPVPTKKKKTSQPPTSRAKSREPLGSESPSRRRAQSSAPFTMSPAAAPLQAATSQAKGSEPSPERPPATKPEASQRPTPSVSDPAAIASWNTQATILENTVFPAGILAGLSLDKTATITALRVLFIRFREEAGGSGSQDSVEKLLLDQLLAAHMKVAELYALAAESKQLDFKALYSNAAARLLSSICQLVTTLTSYRTSTRGRGRGRGKARKRKTGSGDNAGDAAGQEIVQQTDK
jgi:hypothetical protein